MINRLRKLTEEFKRKSRERSKLKAYNILKSFGDPGGENSKQYCLIALFGYNKKSDEKHVLYEYIGLNSI